MTNQAPPQEIIDAAEAVGRWFAERNITDWKLGPCASRTPGELVSIWIASAETAEYGTVYLTDYAGTSAINVAEKIMRAAEREGFKGSIQQRLEMLGWKIVRVTIEVA